MKINKLMPRVVEISQEAGRAILALNFQTTVKGVEQKQDLTPVTAADKAANQIITTELTKLAPKVPIISEESQVAAFGERRGWEYHWLVDPLDGTKEYLSGSKDYTVNIALIYKSQPVLGVIYAPAHQELFFALKDEGAYKQINDMTLKELKVRELPDEGGRLECYISKTHNTNETSSIKENFPNTNILQLGSSLKFCRIAEGAVDFYVRGRATSEWDTAAGQIILEEAGGLVLDIDGTPLHYNKENLDNPSFIAFADPLLEWENLAASLR
jgi:3'(2'), 5'-bisphosphate nucleotidase